MKKKDLKKFEDKQKRKLKEIQEAELFRATCDHKVERKGRYVSTLKKCDDNDGLICTICGSRVDFKPIVSSELKDAVGTIVRAYNQIKSVDEDLSDELLNQIAFIIQMLERTEDLYSLVRNEMVRKSSNDTVNHMRPNYNNDDSYGSYSGRAPRFFVDDDNHKNKNHKNKDKDKNKNKKNHKNNKKYSW